MSGKEQRRIIQTKTIHKQPRADPCSSSSSSYYELDINYSPEKEKLYLQLQSVNKDSLSEILNNDVKVEEAGVKKAVTEDIKEKFLEEIMPLYMTHVASNKKKKKAATKEKDKPRQSHSVCFCSLDYKVPSGISTKKASVVKVADKKEEVVVAEEKLISVIEPVKCGSKSPTTDSCPPTSDTAESLIKRSHKEKGKLTAKKTPQLAEVTSVSSSNNAGDGTPLTSSVDDTQEKIRTRLVKPKHLRKQKPETATVATQVKPKHLKAITFKIQENDQTVAKKNLIHAQVNDVNKELYFILLSQSGFERNKPSVVVNEVNEEVEGNKGSDKEIQTKKADATVSIQTSSVALAANRKVSTAQVQCKRGRKKKGIEGTKQRTKAVATSCETETSTLTEIPVKETPKQLYSNFFMPPTFGQCRLNNFKSATTRKNPLISNSSEPPSPRNTTSTNTDEFFPERRLCTFGQHKKTSAPIQVKDSGAASTNETLLRTEISFSDLNLKPVLSYYMNQFGGVSNCKPTDLVRFYASARAQTANKLRHRPKNSSLVQRLVETSKKVGAFEVGGIEPPKKIGFGVAQMSNKLCTSHFAVIEIVPEEVVSVVAAKSAEDLRGRVVELEDKVEPKEVIKKGKRRISVKTTWRRRWVQKKPVEKKAVVAAQEKVEEKKNLDRIMEESLSTVLEVNKEELPKQRDEIVKKMKEADDHLEQTIDKVLKMDLLTKKEILIQGTKLALIPSKIDEEELIEVPNNNTAKSTKVSLLSEWGTKASTTTSPQSRPSYSSGDISNNALKHRKKRKFKPMLPVKIRNAKPKQKEEKEHAISVVRSATTKSQKRSDSTVATRMGPSLKSTQLVVSCAQKSSTSSRRPLASTFLFTKDYRNSKTKLSAFQKRKLYGEYIRKAETQNHSVHSICEIIVSEEERMEQLKYAKKALPKEYNQEMKVVVKESPMHRFVFHNYNNTSRKPTAPRKPVKKNSSRPIISTKTAPVKRLLSRGRIRQRHNENRFVLMEMFNNRNFEADSSTSLQDKESLYEIFFSQPNGSKSSNTASIDVLSQHERLLVDHADEMVTKTAAKSCEFNTPLHDVVLNEVKSCNAAKGEVSSVEKLSWLPLPKAVAEKFSTDSLETTPRLKPKILPRQNVTIVAYNTEVQYDKDRKSATKTETNNSTVTFGESGYESNKSKNTLKRFFRRKFNIFKSSRMELAPQEAGCSHQPDQAYLCDAWPKETNASLSKSASPKKSNAASHSSTINNAKLTKKVHASASTKKMVTWADVCRRHRLTKGLLEFCYANKSISVEPQQLLQLTYANKKLVDKKEGGAVKPKNVIEVTALPEKLKITVSTNTKDRFWGRKHKTTQHNSQPPAVPDDLIDYMEGRFRELERKIEIAVNTCKTLQDHACMCNENEFHVKETVPHTNISIGLNTQKRPKTSVGTNSTDGLAEKEVNTEKKKKRKRGKSCKPSSSALQAAAKEKEHCCCSTEDFHKKLPQDLDEKVLAVEDFGSVSSEFSRSIRVEVREKQVGGEDRPEEKSTSTESRAKEAELLLIETEAEEEAAPTKTKEDFKSQKRVSIIGVGDLLDESKDGEKNAKEDVQIQRKVGLEKDTVQSKSSDTAHVSIEDGIGEKRASIKDIEDVSPQKSYTFIPCDIAEIRDSMIKNPPPIKVKVATKPPNRFTFKGLGKSKDKPAKEQKPSSSGSDVVEDKSVDAAESLTDKKRARVEDKEDVVAQKRFAFGKSKDSLDGKDQQKPSASRSEALSSKSGDGIGGVKPSEKFNGHKGDDMFSVASEEDVPLKSSKFSKLVAKKDSLIVLVDHKKKENDVRRESDESDVDGPPMDDFRKSRRSISFAAAKAAIIAAQPQEPHEPTKDTKTDEAVPQYTDQELFDKLLESYQRENDIVERLSRDDEFFETQLSAVRSQETIKKIMAETKEEEKQKKSKFSKFFKHKSSVTEIVATRDPASVPSEDQLDVVATADERIADHQMTQIKEDIKAMEAPVKVQFSGSSLTREEKKFIFPKSTDGAGVLQRSDVRTSSLSEVQPKEIGQCFRRGFRPDNIVLTGEPCLKVSEREQMRRISGDDTVMFIDFSERDTPLEFLLGLGFSVDEASNAIKDEDVKNRLNAAITEARVWINKINTTQGTMLYLVAFKTRPRTMRYFLQLVEAIINQRIVDAVKLDGFLKLLEKIEEGNVNMITILGMDRIDDEQNEENMVKKQLRKLFYDVYKIAETEAAANGKELSREAIVLLRILAAKYRAGLQPHLELIARYIGQDLLVNEVQLEAAMIYLARIDTAEVNLRDFEEYCAISCTKEKQLEAKRSGSKKKKHTN